MSSKVRFVFRSKEEKYAEFRPRNPEALKALVQNTGRDHILVNDDNYISFELMKMMLNLELYLAEGSTRKDEQKRDTIKDEIIAVEEARLLHQLFHSLKDSDDKKDKAAWERLKTHLDAIKLFTIAKNKLSKKKKK